jgi:hypothetical protein
MFNRRNLSNDKLYLLKNKTCCFNV